MTDQKYCGRRRHWVPIANFDKSSTTKDRLQAWCRDCKNEYYLDQKVLKFIEYSERGWSKA